MKISFKCSALGLNNRPLEEDQKPEAGSVEERAIQTVDLAREVYFELNPLTREEANDPRKLDGRFNEFAKPVGRLALNYHEYTMAVIESSGDREAIPGRLTPEQIRFYKWIDQQRKEIDLCIAVLKRIAE